MIDIEFEMPYPLIELGKHLATPRSGSSIRRWIDEGMPHRDDGALMLHMEYVTIADVKHSTVEAYHRLIKAVNTPLAQLTEEERRRHALQQTKRKNRTATRRTRDPQPT